ncbi:MAG: potassium channel family protein [Fodinibius sp.]|nr:potassium channel family protein [Fodinibius sp.]MDZ7660523.1 potassium channel family protein [Fodinibius sp.]
MSTPASVVEAGTGTAAGAFTKLYFSGYTLSTLGMGDYIPGTKAWQVVTSVFSFAGFIFITTAMTYLMSLTNAVTHKKKLALFISNLGDSPEEIVLNSYLGRKPALLMDRIPVLQDMINSHNQNHFAHPAVHYFHSSAKKESFSINLANLNEAIIIITYFIKYDSAVEKELRLLQDAIAKFLVTASHHYKPITKTALRDTPALESLGRQGIPTIDEPILSSADWQNIERRRAQLTGLLQSNGWNWQHIFAKPQS